MKMTYKTLQHTFDLCTTQLSLKMALHVSMDHGYVTFVRRLSKEHVNLLINNPRKTNVLKKIMLIN